MLHDKLNLEKLITNWRFIWLISFVNAAVLNFLLLRD